MLSRYSRVATATSRLDLPAISTSSPRPHHQPLPTQHQHDYNNNTQTSRRQNGGRRRRSRARSTRRNGRQVDSIAAACSTASSVVVSRAQTNNKRDLKRSLFAPMSTHHSNRLGMST